MDAGTRDSGPSDTRALNVFAESRVLGTESSFLYECVIALAAKRDLTFVGEPSHQFEDFLLLEIGRASCRERVYENV
jgi:hypothetical protein